MLEKALAWFYARKGNTTYSMVHRNGPGSYDCSSAVYFAAKEAGLLPAGLRIGNTDSLYGDLERNGWIRVTDGSRQRGDVFLWGKRGASSGGAGHTGKLLNANDIIHCAFGYNGIHVDNHDWLWRLNGSPEVTVYRFVGSNVPMTSNPIDQIVGVGSYIRFDGIFTVNDVQPFGGIWQVRTDELCEGGFTWTDNGIPAEPLVEVDADGYATIDQELAIGARYKIPGKFYVHDVGFAENMWLALIDWKGLKFWIDLEDATEVSADNGGTPVPTTRPPAPQPPKPDVPPVVQPPVVQPPTTSEPPVVVEPPVVIQPPVVIPPVPEPPKEEPKPPLINNPKENTMAFTDKDVKQLKIATESVQKTIDDVAASEGVQEIVQGISKATKLKVYIIGDTLLGLGLITPTLAVVLEWGNLNQIVALSSLFATAGAFVLTMFGIYKNGKK